MDKKTQFQIQTSQSKLIKYRETLKNLQVSRDNIENTSSQSNPDRSKIIELKSKQVNLESKQQLFKKDINFNVNNISNANKDLLLLDKIKDDKLKEEDNIFSDELNRIEEDIIKAKSSHEISIDNAYIDILDICQNIELIKSELEIQNDIVSQVQLESHSSRKQILGDLHNKKQEKIQTQQHINNFKESEADFAIQILSLENTNTNIIEFKKMLIDVEYNLDYDPLTLSNYYNEFSEFNLDTQLHINDKIAQLDKILNDNQNRIHFINKKFHKHKQSNTIRLTTILDTYNKLDRFKVIGYKTKIKIEKEKQSLLKNILSDLSNKYNTFETLIINKFHDELTFTNNELENDKTRSDNRLKIMKIRILEDYENEKKRLNNIIIDSKSNLENIQIEINNINNELDIVKQIIIKEDVFNNELEQINIEILKYQNIIKQTESDIEKLSNVSL